jgi:hypothetical protein
MNEKLAPAQVRAWLAEVQADLRGLDQKLQPILEEQRRLEEREALLRNLLASFDTPEPDTDRASLGAGRRNGSVREYVVARAAEILRDEGAPLHINDLHTRFIERGFTVPGKGEPVNLIVHLQKSEEVVSPQRGLYGLREQIGTVRPRGKRKRATSRRRRKG